MFGTNCMMSNNSSRSCRNPITLVRQLSTERKGSTHLPRYLLRVLRDPHSISTSLRGRGENRGLTPKSHERCRAHYELPSNSLIHLSQPLSKHLLLHLSQHSLILPILHSVRAAVCARVPDEECGVSELVRIVVGPSGHGGGVGGTEVGLESRVGGGEGGREGACREVVDDLDWKWISTVPSLRRGDSPRDHHIYSS
jgi:hypothetical protein